jgi:hypothetical protein
LSDHQRNRPSFGASHGSVLCHRRFAVTENPWFGFYLAVRGKLDRKEGAFDLGRFELPVAVVALIWLALAMFVLVTPDEAFVPVMIVVGLMLAGGLFFLGILIFDRKSLDSAPDAEPVFTH